jgi:hypothetical protein
MIASEDNLESTLKVRFLPLCKALPNYSTAPQTPISATRHTGWHSTVNLFSNPHQEQATAQEFFVILR